jgi:hypothetical protein
MHGVALFVFSKCCPNQAIEKANLDKSDLETVRAPRCIDKSDRDGSKVQAACIADWDNLKVDQPLSQSSL